MGVGRNVEAYVWCSLWVVLLCGGLFGGWCGICLNGWLVLGSDFGVVL